MTQRPNNKLTAPAGDGFSTETSSKSIDPQRCPRCQALNHCALEEGKGTCWCFSYKISEDVLKKIPEPSRGKACLCESCASSQGELEVESSAAYKLHQRSRKDR